MAELTITSEAKLGDADLVCWRARPGRRPPHCDPVLAHLAPDIVEAAIAGRMPNGIGFRELVDPPIAWSRQRQKIGTTSSH